MPHPQQVLMAAPAILNPLTAFAWTQAHWASDPLWTPPSDGANIPSWRDGSGGGRNLGPTTKNAVYRAAYAGLNNRPAVDTLPDGFITSSGGTTTAQPCTMVIVVKIGTIDNGALSSGGTGGSAGIRVISSTGMKWGIHFGTNTPSATIVDATLPHLLIAEANGASSRLLLDGTSILTANAGANGVAALTVGNNIAGTIVSAFGFVGVMSGVMSAANQAIFRSWSQTFYGTP